MEGVADLRREAGPLKSALKDSYPIDITMIMGNRYGALP